MRVSHGEANCAYFGFLPKSAKNKLLLQTVGSDASYSVRCWLSSLWVLLDLSEFFSNIPMKRHGNKML